MSQGIASASSSAGCCACWGCAVQSRLVLRRIIAVVGVSKKLKSSDGYVNFSSHSGVGGSVFLLAQYGVYLTSKSWVGWLQRSSSVHRPAVGGQGLQVLCGTGARAGEVMETGLQ